MRSFARVGQTSHSMMCSMMFSRRQFVRGRVVDHADMYFTHIEQLNMKGILDVMKAAPAGDTIGDAAVVSSTSTQTDFLAHRRDGLIAASALLGVLVDTQEPGTKSEFLTEEALSSATEIQKLSEVVMAELCASGPSGQLQWVEDWLEHYTSLSQRLSKVTDPTAGA